MGGWYLQISQCGRRKIVTQPFFLEKNDSTWWGRPRGAQLPLADRRFMNASQFDALLSRFPVTRPANFNRYATSTPVPPRTTSGTTYSFRRPVYVFAGLQPFLCLLPQRRHPRYQWFWHRHHLQQVPHLVKPTSGGRWRDFWPFTLAGKRGTLSWSSFVHAMLCSSSNPRPFHE